MWKEAWRVWWRSSTATEWRDVEQEARNKTTKNPPAHGKQCKKASDVEKVGFDALQFHKTHSRQVTSSLYYVICIWQKW